MDIRNSEDPEAYAVLEELAREAGPCSEKYGIKMDLEVWGGARLWKAYV